MSYNEIMTYVMLLWTESQMRLKFKCQPENLDLHCLGRLLTRPPERWAPRVQGEGCARGLPKACSPAVLLTAREGRNVGGSSSLFFPFHLPSPYSAAPLTGEQNKLHQWRQQKCRAERWVGLRVTRRAPWPPWVREGCWEIATLLCVQAWVGVAK